VLATPPVYVAFDVLYARGEDLRGRPLAARREMLEEIVDGAGSVFVVPRLSANGHEAWAEVQRRGLEGFVAKDPGSPYTSGGSTRSWLKVKLRHDGRFVVGGVVERAEGWSLLLGSAERRQLRYRGLVHWGVGRRLAEALTANGLVRSTSPFSDRVPLRRVTWLEPRLMAEVSYANMTANGLRAPVFRGFHEPH
jgi:bifunctional non-homologous end joining protein LigD